MKISLILKYLLVSCFIVYNAALADVPAGQVKEVMHLLDFVKNSGCIINRNGTDHPAEKGISYIEKNMITSGMI